MRTTRTNGGTTYKYIYNGSQLTQMTVGGNTLSFIYDATGAPVVVVWNGTPYYYVTTLQGDVLVIMDLDGEVVVSYEYDAWGNILSTTGSLASTLGTLNPLRYRGYVYDQETGLYYLQSRYYNPEWGRFLNADSVMAGIGSTTHGHNLFAYCFNNPVIYRDSSGTWPEYTCDTPAGELGRKIGDAIADWLQGIIDAFPTKEEHYNRNDHQADVLGMDPQDIIDSDDWVEQPDFFNMFHQNTTGKQGKDAKDNVK